MVQAALMEKKHLLGGVVLVLAVVAFFGYPYVRLLQLKLDADKLMIDDLGRFPTPDEIIDVDERITALAQRHGFATPTYAKRISMRSVGNSADMYYVLQITVTVDGKQLSLSRRIDTGGLENEFAVLQEAGIKVPGEK
jgi:hypothetical protein